MGNCPGRALSPPAWRRSGLPPFLPLAPVQGDCYDLPVFGIGYLELMVLGLLVILLFPPRELPKLARQAARAYGSVRRLADEFHRTVMLDDELRSPIDEIRGAYDEARWDIRRAGDRLKEEVSSVGRSMKGAVHRDEEDDDDAFEELDAHEQAYLEQGASQELAPINPSQPIPPPPDDFASAAQPEDSSAAMPAAKEPSTAPLPSPAPTPPRIDEDEVTPVAPRDAYQSPYGSPKPGATGLGSSASVPGRVASSGAGIPGAAPQTVESLLDPQSPESNPGTPHRAMPGRDSDKIDESALTRVARLPMPPSAADPHEDSDPSTKGASS